MCIKNTIKYLTFDMELSIIKLIIIMNIITKKDGSARMRLAEQVAVVTGAGSGTGK